MPTRWVCACAPHLTKHCVFSSLRNWTECKSAFFSTINAVQTGTNDNHLFLHSGPFQETWTANLPLNEVVFGHTYASKLTNSEKLHGWSFCRNFIHFKNTRAHILQADVMVVWQHFRKKLIPDFDNFFFFRTAAREARLDSGGRPPKNVKGDK